MKTTTRPSAKQHRARSKCAHTVSNAGPWLDAFKDATEQIENCRTWLDASDAELVDWAREVLRDTIVKQQHLRGICSSRILSATPSSFERFIDRSFALCAPNP